MVSMLFFYKDITGQDICETIKSFFSSGFLLKELNCTTIAFVLKCDKPSLCKDFRLISCCNILYKCIAKILANRLKGILPNFINKA